jgi:hypothetical protein
MPHVEIILDRSGSMASLVTDTVGGINEFVKEQPKGTTFTLTQFDYGTKVELDRTYTSARKKEAKITASQYQPRGLTPLLDAVGTTIERVLAEPFTKKDRVTILVITDGYENASRDFTREKVKELVGQAKEKGFQVVFMGADIDAYGEAGSIGIGSDQTMSFAGASTGAAYSSMARSVNIYNTGMSDSVMAEDVDE